MAATAIAVEPPVLAVSPDTPVMTAWPLWKKVVAYAALAALAGVSIWFVDRRARLPGGGHEQQRAAE